MHYQDDYIAIFKMADTKQQGMISCQQLVEQMKRFGYKDIEKNFKVKLETIDFI